MKKTYTRPVVSFESFELSTSIATGCEYKSNHQQGTCGYNVPNVGNVFISTEQGCDYTSSDGDYGICYHVPVDTSNLFTS